MFRIQFRNNRGEWIEHRYAGEFLRIIDAVDKVKSFNGRVFPADFRVVCGIDTVVFSAKDM